MQKNLLIIALCLELFNNTWHSLEGWYNFQNGTAEWNDCVSFRILQEYNLRNGTGSVTRI